jgi:Acyltransferase
VAVSGLDKFDANGQYLLLSNHRSIIDPCIIEIALRDTNILGLWVAKKELYNSFFFGKFVRNGGSVLLDRESSNMSQFFKSIKIIGDRPRFFEVKGRQVMNIVIQTAQSLITVMILAMTFIATCALAEETNPYANTPPGAIPESFGLQNMQRDAEERRKKTKAKEEKRAAIKQKIFDEELAKAQAEARAGASHSVGPVAETRGRKRMQPYYEKWKQEDAAERLPLQQQNEQTYRQFQQTGNKEEYGRQMRDMWKQMGIEVPPESR